MKKHNENAELQDAFYNLMLRMMRLDVKLDGYQLRRWWEQLYFTRKWKA